MTFKRITLMVLTGLMMASPIANADFVVVSKAPQASAASSHYSDAIQGFGKGVRFGDFLQEVMPGDWVVSHDPFLSDELIDWEGGVGWDELIKRVSNDYGWKANFNREMKYLSITDDMTSIAALGGRQADVTSASGGRFGALDERKAFNIRGKSLEQVLRVLAPQGWRVDLQISPSLLENVVDYSGEQTRGGALREVLAPMGLIHLPYANMSPAPLLVIVSNAGAQ